MPEQQSSPQEAGRSSKRWGVVLYALIGMAVGLGLLYWLWQKAGATLEGHDIVAILPVLPWVLLWYFVPMFAGNMSWLCLFPKAKQPPVVASYVMTWIGMGVNWLLPVAMVGGEVVKLRLAMRRAWHPYALIASLVGDKTLQVATQGLFTMIGLSCLVILSGRADGWWQALLGAVVFIAAVFIFYKLQTAGIFSGLAAKLARFSKQESLMNLRAARVDAALRLMYRRPARWWQAAAWRMGFRFLWAVEVVIVLQWQGVEAGILHALALESLSQGARAAAFIIPAGIGAQEAGLMAVGLFLGLPAEALLLLAVVKRLRELIIGGVSLLIWQWQEGHWWWQRRAQSSNSA